jgi:hypothetical protein
MVAMVSYQMMMMMMMILPLYLSRHYLCMALSVPRGHANHRGAANRKRQQMSVFCSDFYSGEEGWLGSSLDILSTALKVLLVIPTNSERKN